MHLVFLDAETFWSQDVTLKKMSPGEYLAHPEFELQSISIRVDRGRAREKAQVYFGEANIRQALDAADLSNALVIGHNMSGFDSLILAWKLGYNPAMFGCTLAMARPVLGHLTALGLGALVKFLGIGVKNDAVLHQTRGRHLCDFTAQELDEMRTYNGDDTDQCAELFYKLIPYFTPGELWQIDTTIRARAFPELELDQPLLEDTLVKERAKKREDLLELADAIGVRAGASDEETFEVVRARLASAPKFVALLTELGADVPYKPSPGNPAKLIPALAKTDEGFLELLGSEDELVAQAAAARLSIKSTLLETRIGKLLTARRTSYALPIPLKYAGAKVTDRWAGEEYNPQNLPRILRTPRNSDALRQSIVAPAGKVIGVSDAAAIELRVNHHLWQVPRTVAAYKANPVADLYRDFAAARWHKTPEEVDDDERQLGKVCIAEGQLVLTNQGLVPIEQVTCSHLLWDGVDWVAHGGTVCNGVKPVITYQGLTATADHKVWVENGSAKTLESARENGEPLARTGAGRVSLRFLEGTEQPVRSAGPVSLFTLPMQVWNRARNCLRLVAQRHLNRLSRLWAQMRGTCVVDSAYVLSLFALHFPQRSGLGALRGSRHRVSFPIGGSGSGMDYGELRAASELRGGSHRQQRALRAGQLAVEYATSKCQQSRGQYQAAVQRIAQFISAGAVRRQYLARSDSCGVKQRGDSSSVGTTELQTERRVWDILNAGPRHRFTVSDVLVSNCHLQLGFGSGWRTFQRTAKAQHKLVMSDEVAQSATYEWRETYREIPAGWNTCHEALNYIAEGSERQIDPGGLCHTVKDGIVLPSGSILRYPNLRQILMADPVTGVEKWEWVYGVGRFARRIYGPKVVHNCVQKLARDVVAEVGLQFFQMTGLRWKLIVHDELVYLFPESEATELLAKLETLMRARRAWWPQLILWSNGGLGHRYSDAH